MNDMAPNILIVDDSIENITLLRTILELSFDRADLHSVTDGEQALEYLETHRPDLILLDAVLPGVSGFDVCEKVKQDEATSRIPILMISGILIEREDRVAALEHGAEGYLCKPFERDELLALVRTLLRMKKYEDALQEQESRLAAMLDDRTQNLQQREKYLDDLFNRSADPIFVEDFNGTVLDCNEAAATLHDIPRDELIGMNVVDLVPEGCRDDTALRFPDWAEGLHEFEGWSYTRQGQAIPVEIRGSRVEYGGQAALLFHVRDISKRKEAEGRLEAYQQGLEKLVEERSSELYASNALLERTRADFHSIVEKSMEGVLVLNREGTVLYANPAAMQLLQVSDDDLVGNTFEYLVDQGQELQIETERDDGSRAVIEALYSDTEWHGEVARLVTLRDVSMWRLAEMQLARSEHIESLGVLAGGIAHDFNNLLSGIVGNVSYARLRDLSDSQRSDALGEAEGAAARAKSLTQQLLTFAKGGAPVRSVVDVMRLLEENARFCLAGSRCAHRIVAENNLWSAYVDGSQIAQVIENLVINAAQSMPQGGTVRISARNYELESDGVSRGLNIEPGKYLQVAFRDDGVGIDKETISKIFDPYFTTKENGSGLGLAICYSIVAKHGGDLTVESVQGKGATFTLYIPATMEEEEEAMTESNTPAAVSGQGKRVLVMDDEEVIRNLLSRILETLSYESVSVEDGQEAVDAYKAAQAVGNPFDVVILDLTIPGGMGGGETLVKLQEVDPDVKALVSSGYSASDVFSGYESHGFAGVIAKPYNVKELAAAIAQVVAG